MPYTQEHRLITITTPLGDDVLLLKSFNGLEAISQLFHFSAELLSENHSIAFTDIVGKKVTLNIELSDKSNRHWNG